jgi:hypothetical protein
MLEILPAFGYGRRKGQIEPRLRALGLLIGNAGRIVGKTL